MNAAQPGSIEPHTHAPVRRAKVVYTGAAAAWMIGIMMVPHGLARACLTGALFGTGALLSWLRVLPFRSKARPGSTVFLIVSGALLTYKAAVALGSTPDWMDLALIGGLVAFALEGVWLDRRKD